MSREIKFRAWDKKDLCMREATSLLFNSKNVLSHIGFEPFEQQTEYTDYANEFIVMQFTGLHDKNGKEIWEGDVIRTTLTGVTLSDRVLEVVYGNDLAQFYASSEGKWACSLAALAHPQDGDGCEVLGNIYSNPELVK